ncbi:hypothetical protein ACS0PU_005950 [Formica fusca]
MPKKRPSRERSVRDHPQRRRCYVSTVAKLLISQERTLNLRDFGRKVAPRSNPSLPLVAEGAWAG